MARRRTAPDAIRTKWQLADRLRTIRVEQFGEHGLATFAQLLDVPVRTWYSYEAGVTVPAEVLLKFVQLTSVEPGWLLHGREPKYQRPSLDNRLSAEWSQERNASHSQQEAMPNEAGRGFRWPTQPNHPGGPGPESWSRSASATAVIDLGEPDLEAGPENGPWQFAVREEWHPAPLHCQFVRVEGDAMAPIVADGAFVGYCEAEEDVAELDGRLVVAWPEGTPLVRWLHHSPEFVVLRAERSASLPSTHLIDLAEGLPASPVRRVLWIGTPH